MQNLSMCRICLATDVRLCSVARSLQDMYEKLTEVTFEREDGRPLAACYICYARLQNCYRLRASCLQSEELLTEMLTSGELVPRSVSSTNTLRVVSVLHFSLQSGSLGHVLQDSTGCHVKEEAAEVIHDAELEQQNTEDIKLEPQEEHDVQIDDDIQCSHLEDPLDAMKREPDDVQTDADDIKLEIEDIIIKENNPISANQSSLPAYNICPKIVNVVLERMVLNNTIPATDAEVVKLETEDIILKENEQNGAVPFLQLTDNRCPKIVKVVLERIDQKDPRTGIPVLKKLAETDSHLAMDSENNAFNKNSDDEIDASSLIQRDNKVIFHYKGYKKSFKSKNCSINKSFFKSKSQFELYTCTLTSKKWFRCDLCKKSFENRTSFRYHMYKHINKKRFQCDVCNKCFNSKQYLTLHMCIHTGENKFQCDVCNKFFKSKQYLAQHMYIHTGENRFKCDVCNKSYWNKYYLSEHMYTHTNNKRFQCDVCNRGFTHKCNLRRHMLTHTDKKPFQCDVCNRCFREKSHLTRHINLLHTLV